MNIYVKHGCDCIFECIFLQALLRCGLNCGLLDMMAKGPAIYLCSNESASSLDEYQQDQLLTRILKIGLKMESFLKCWILSVHYCLGFPTSWCQDNNVGVSNSKCRVRRTLLDRRNVQLTF